MTNAQSKNEIADMLREFCLKEGYEFYPDYSGRCMYGRECVGIVHGDSESTMLMRLGGFVVSAHRDNPDEAMRILRLIERASHDCMGLDAITYWPDIAINPEK